MDLARKYKSRTLFFKSNREDGKPFLGLAKGWFSCLQGNTVCTFISQLLLSNTLSKRWNQGRAL